MDYSSKYCQHWRENRKGNKRISVINSRPVQAYRNVKPHLLTFGIGEYIAIFLETSDKFYSKTNCYKNQKSSRTGLFSFLHRYRSSYLLVYLISNNSFLAHAFWHTVK